MTLMIDHDLSLYCDWPQRRVYAPDTALETKSVQQDGAIDGPDALWRLMNEMTAEMREQFRFFRELREGAGAALDEAADDAAGKLARADVKAATDAMSLIVRTLEKIDTLQRQLARDREAQAESEADNQDYEQAVAFFQKRIDDLVEQKLRARLGAAGLAPEGQPADGGE
ncbi:hypothetical protein RMR16_003000 [Agrobacterium sp. rho-13.3]|uniref:hypothetical protein n=1 Tax=Agrobacterium sp. rho-13.3 TaxID=3072980 RepID=UPI002A0EE58B|nr:hypothetical protein [Agrobacterium sp. rho-13.3]MDX8308775.1 hypothetical protein [Agrobacterium sp. rho-13.3]